MSFINFIDFCAVKIHDFLDDRHERKIDLMQKKRHCDNCDRLVHLLELSEARQVKLLEKIGSVEAKAPQPTEIPKPLGNDYLPWSVRRAKLESESAKLARELKEFELSKKPENHQLELELESNDL